MTLEDFKDVHKDKAPVEKLRLMQVQHDYWRNDVKDRVDANWRGNYEKARYYASECDAMADRVAWLYDEISKALEKDMKTDWKVVDRDGNPAVEGTYDVILIYSDWDAAEKEPSNERFATRDMRWFGDAVKAGLENWVMDDQPDHGLVWTQETGSYPCERVYAWLPQHDYPHIDLPEGVKWE